MTAVVTVTASVGGDGDGDGHGDGWRCAADGFPDGYAEGREPCFPYGTYEMRRLHGVAVEPAPRDGEALVTAPGPLLSDVKAELEALRGTRTQAEARQHKQQGVELMQEVRQAFEEEAPELCEHEALELHEGRSVVAAMADAARGERPPRRIRHRFDPAPRDARAQQAGPDGARRLVVLRDARRGRPPGTPRHGADPPG